MMLQSLANKYFITGALIPAGFPGIFGRGKIIGPVNDLGMHYLCEVYAIDAAALTARSQCVYTLEFLARGDVYLYDDKEIWELEVGRTHAAIKEMQKQIKAAAAKKEQQRAQAMKKLGVEVLSPEEIETIVDEG